MQSDPTTNHTQTLTHTLIISFEFASFSIHLYRIWANLSQFEIDWMKRILRPLCENFPSKLGHLWICVCVCNHASSCKYFVLAKMWCGFLHWTHCLSFVVCDMHRTHRFLFKYKYRNIIFGNNCYLEFQALNFNSIEQNVLLSNKLCRVYVNLRHFSKRIFFYRFFFSGYSICVRIVKAQFQLNCPQITV